MKSALPTLLLVIALTLTAQAQTAKFVTGALVLTDGKQTIRIPDVTDAPKECPKPAKVYSVVKSGADYYVLVTTSVYTRGFPPHGGPCGGGVELSIICLHIVDGKEADRTVGLYESCHKDRKGKVLGFKGAIFTVTSKGPPSGDDPASQAADSETITFTYDSKSPADGIKEEHKLNPRQ